MPKKIAAEDQAVDGSQMNIDGSDGEVRTSAIHFSLQGKGGVGKSLIASILAQYFNAKGKPIRCIDTDPVNRTFYQYKSLNVTRLELLHEGTIDARGFDALMETLLTEDSTFIVDNGASTFIPLWNYILENRALGVLAEAGKMLYVHTVVTGGQALLDTLFGFKSLAESTSDQNIVVWLNEYFGRIENDGKQFVEMSAYTENQGKICGSVLLQRRNPDTFGRDLETVISRKLTIDEAIKDGPFSIMTKQRLKVMQRDWFEQLDAVGLI